MLIKQQKSNGGGQYVNIKKGTLVIKSGENPDGSPKLEEFASIKGIIYKIDFIEDEYQGSRYEKMQIFINSEGKNYILQMGTDSGYFRGFCNSLKSGIPTSEVIITPSSKPGENGKTNTTCFIQQDGKFLKHYYKKDANSGKWLGKEGELLPDLKMIEFKGKKQPDNSDQIKFWKDWLYSQYNEENEPEVSPTPEGFEFENDDDLPF